MIILKPDGIHTVAMLTSLERFREMKTMYVELLRAREVLDMPGMVVYEMPNQIIVELYTAIADTPDYLFKNQTIVLGFRTEHIEALYQKMLDDGYQMLSPVQQAGECYSYFHYLSPDQHVYLISQLNKQQHH